MQLFLNFLIYRPNNCTSPPLMKKLACSVYLLLSYSLSHAQRHGGKRLYEETGLPSGEVVGNSLKYAIPLLLIGFIIAYFNLWSEEAQKSKTNDNLGCFGMIIMGAGLLFLLPLLAWIEFAAHSIILLFMALGVIGFVIALIYSAFNKKNK